MAPKIAPTVVADASVSEPAAIESRMPNSMPPYIPISDAGIIVTEYGVASLHGKSIRERVHALTEIAHPNFRDALKQYAFEQNWW